MMEWRIAQPRVIKYDGNLLEPPVHGKRTNRFEKKTTIRGKDDDSDGEDF
jgi:hypothetical protein